VTTEQTTTRAWVLTLLIASGVWAMEGCTPRVEVVPSDKPITINLNVKIDHEIRIKIEKELQEVLSEESGLF
jgi:YnbE-like lipoprotein